MREQKLEPVIGQEIIDELTEPARRVMEVLRKHGHPYMSVVIDQTNADIHESVAGFIRLPAVD